MNSTITIPKILLPKSDVDMSKWSVIACDQFTSQPAYWEQVDKLVGDAPSALRIIYPEVYLEEANKRDRIKAINDNMQKYLQSGIFEEFEGFILVERTTPDGQKRLGLVLAVDLEDYEYTEQNNALIKATEKTVVERLPARIEVRKGACLESPHIMMLMDDRKRNIIERLYARRGELEIAYDFALNMGGGSIKGYKIEDKDCNRIIDDLNSLLDRNTLTEKYGSDRPILFAVGDGNHSLATAKECWNNIKKTLSSDEFDTHPARYALCELVNLHDDSLKFEPIHRAVFGVDEKFIEFMRNELAKLDGKSSVKVVYGDKEFSWRVSANASDAIADIQQLMDEYNKTHKDMVIDYIHGDGHLLSVAKEKNAVAVFMPCLEKDGLFDYVVRRGVLPRKSFSMGHAEDKRYYLECRVIL
ncbi:MAG: DUF1015 domain-containing protein [Clostridia bacterium]|nr:DUF1015 domain-containing protein [Clostridia bacterium]MDE6472758.1 DUF1015 domain-containing protein [Clostridia bacterium]